MSAHADHEAYLRAALHAAADSLEPHGDGLERIRARLRQPRPAPIAWALAASAELVLRTPAWLQDVVYQVADWFRLVVERFAPAQAPGRHRSRAQGLMRPLAAMAVVMFIVAVGTYVAIDGSTAIFPSSSNSQPGAPGGGGHPGTPAPSASHTSGGKSTLGTGSRPTGSPSCKSSSPNANGATTSAPPPQSPGASATPTPDASTSTDTPSPSPDDTSTTPAAGPSAPASVAPPANPPTGSPANTPALTKPPAC
jgi:hypothetical protein